MSNFLSTKEAAGIKQILENGGIVAFPTDTVWGIGCLAENKAAVQKIYSLKERDKGKPLILLGKDIDSLLPYIGNFHEKAKIIAEKYLPGALTLVLKKSGKTPDYITAGFDTIGIRIPDCPVFLELLEKATETGVLATTSANISEMGSNSTKEEVIEQIGDKVDYILDDFGFEAKGTESTVAFVSQDGKIKIFRQGAIKIEI